MKWRRHSPFLQEITLAHTIYYHQTPNWSGEWDLDPLITSDWPRIANATLTDHSYLVFTPFTDLPVWRPNNYAQSAVHLPLKTLRDGSDILPRDWQLPASRRRSAHPDRNTEEVGTTVTSSCPDSMHHNISGCIFRSDILTDDWRQQPNETAASQRTSLLWNPRTHAQQSTDNTRSTRVATEHPSHNEKNN